MAIVAPFMHRSGSAVRKDRPSLRPASDASHQPHNCGSAVRKDRPSLRQFPDALIEVARGQVRRSARTALH